jgi:hypothetical protein
MMISAADSLMPSAQQFGIMAVLLAAVVALYLYSRRRRRPTDGTPKQYRRELNSATAQGRTVQRDMEQLLTELERLAARLNEQLDAKHQDLQQSLAEADKRISALRILLEEAKRRLDRGPLPAAPAREGAPADVVQVDADCVRPERPPAPTPAPSMTAPTMTATTTTATVAQPAAIIAGRLTPRPVGQVEPRVAAIDERPASDRRRRIYQLADEGLTPLQIAVQLGQPVGEVELILNLRVAQPLTSDVKGQPPSAMM